MSYSEKRQVDKEQNMGKELLAKEAGEGNNKQRKGNSVFGTEAQKRKLQGPNYRKVRY